MATGAFDSGFSSGFQHAAAAAVAVATRPAFVAAPPTPTVELAVEFTLITQMHAAVTADDEAMTLAMLGLVDDLELDILFD